MQPTTELTPCPLCGARQGYSLFDGSSSRWWNILCSACGEQVSECRADPDTPQGGSKPLRWAGADAEWRRQGEYAERLRTALAALVFALDGTSELHIRQARELAVVALRGRL